jgi:hypothetical protein
MKKLSKLQRDNVCTILAIGGTRIAAARFVGCSVDDLDELMAHDPEFARELDKATGNAEALQLKNLAEAAHDNKDWRASAWLLERRFPQRYARRPPAAAAQERLERVLDSFIDLIVSQIADAGLRQQILDQLTELARQPSGRETK